MPNKILKITLIILGYLAVFAIITNVFDADFGWHLRYGRDTIAGSFPYLDTYTYSSYGQPWTNHEWGGDIIFWLFYSLLGYFSIPILVAASVWGALLGMIKIFCRELTTARIIAAILGVLSIYYVISPRLAFTVLILFVLTLYILEKKKYFYLLPAIIWLWSILHGSWILGVIVVNIYLFGNLAAMIMKKYWPKFSGADAEWTRKDFLNVILWQIVAAAAVCLNPYGINIWREVGQYLSPEYFKEYVNEWLPSYTYPIYVWPLIIGAVSAAFAVIGYLKKKITLAQALLFAAICFATWNAKRQAIYLVLVSLPIIAEVFERVTLDISEMRLNRKKIFYAQIIFIFLAIAGIILALVKTNYSSNVWKDDKFLERKGLPVGAVKFLAAETKNKSADIFNEFRWGGYLNWTLPNDRVYLDGRGTATWYVEPGKTLLQSYREIKFEANGLAALNSSTAEYVILSRDYIAYPAPNAVNKIVFGDELDKIFSAEASQLEKMLKKSPNWTLVYEDNIARVWKRARR